MLKWRSTDSGTSAEEAATSDVPKVSTPSLKTPITSKRTWKNLMLRPATSSVPKRLRASSSVRRHTLLNERPSEESKKRPDRMRRFRTFRYAGVVPITGISRSRLVTTAVAASTPDRF